MLQGSCTAIRTKGGALYRVGVASPDSPFTGADVAAIFWVDGERHEPGSCWEVIYLPEYLARLLSGHDPAIVQRAVACLMALAASKTREDSETAMLAAIANLEGEEETQVKALVGEMLRAKKEVQTMPTLVAVDSFPAEQVVWSRRTVTISQAIDQLMLRQLDEATTRLDDDDDDDATAQDDEPADASPLTAEPAPGAAAAQ